MHLAPPDGARFQASAGDCHCAVTLPLRVSDARGRACESATSGVAFFAPILLFAFRDRNLFGLAGISILVVSSGTVLLRDWERYRRPGPLGGTLLAFWGLSAIAAVMTNHYGFL